jgi:hypothetical protein
MSCRLPTSLCWMILNMWRAIDRLFQSVRFNAAVREITVNFVGNRGLRPSFAFPGGSDRFNADF